MKLTLSDKSPILILMLSIFLLPLQAQYRLADEVEVYRGTHLLLDPWVGGLNNPQFSQFDLNQDGFKDLVIFDKVDFSWYTFLHEGVAGSWSYRWDPSYQQYFPELGDWGILKDFNGDGLEDIFNYFGAGLSVYKASLDSEGLPVFEQVYERAQYINGSTTTVAYAGRVDIPGFVDVTGDGDLDYLTFGSIGGYVRYFENQAVENGWSLDSILYDWVSTCWGEWIEGAACNGGDLNSSCLVGPDPEEYARVHAGSALCPLDRNGDGALDLILGDAGCQNQVYLQNGTSSANAIFESQDLNFPIFDVPVHLTFGAGYHLDINQDGLGDLVFAPNSVDEGENDRQVWLYENTRVDSVLPQFISDSFLIEQMVNDGAYSRPVFFDANADGLLDIIVGLGIYDNGSDSTSGLAYYENTGDLDLPQYHLRSRDYAGLSTLNRSYLIPCFGDLDGDGDEDMVLGDAGGSLSYLENTAGAGNPASWASPETDWKGINEGTHSAPFLFDVNRDGLLDLITGERNGNLNYFRNFGSVSSPNFILDSDFWGGVDTRGGSPTGYSVPFLRKNPANQIELYVGSLGGTIYRYSNLDGNLLGTFTLDSDQWRGFAVGEQSNIALADINGDDAMEVILGNARGGLQLWTEKGQPSVGIEDQLQDNWSLYPNPSGGIFFVRGWEVNQMPRIFNALGQSVNYNWQLSGDLLQIDMGFNASGIYWLLDEQGRQHKFVVSK
jgi:hypothetical protein